MHVLAQTRGPRPAAIRLLVAGLAFSTAVAATAAPGDVRAFSATWDFHNWGGPQSNTTQFRIYVPPAIDVPRLRGAVFLLPGSGGDWRFRAEDHAFQEAARSLGFALVGVGTSAGLTSFSSTAQAEAALDAILSAAAAATGRAELVNVPVVPAGFSLGGYAASTLVAHVPHRILAAVGHRGSLSLSGGADLAASRRVHTLLIPGSLDTTIRPNDQGRTVFPTYRGSAAPGHAAFAIDWGTGHASFDNQGWSMAWTWIAESLATRLAADAWPALEPGQPLPLDTVPLSSGWLGQRVYAQSTDGSDRSAFPAIAPEPDYAATPSASASWLPNETVARVYRAFSAYDGVAGRAIPRQGPLAITGAAAPSTVVQNGQVNPPQLAVLPLGSTLDITVDPRGFGALAVPAQDLLANGDFALWTAGRPEGWTVANFAADRVKPGPALVAGRAPSALLRNVSGGPEIRQTFADPVTGDFTLSFTFALNKNATGWSENMLFTLYQGANEWLAFRFGGNENFYFYVHDGSAWVIPSGVTVVNRSTYDFAAGAYVSGPHVYEFTLTYSASSGTYSASYGPPGGAKTTHPGLAAFRTPASGGLTALRFYANADGFALDDVRLSRPIPGVDPVKSMEYHDGDRLLAVQTAPGPEGWRLPLRLDTPGVRSLGVVAEDHAGNRSAAFRTIVVARPDPEDASYYRFEYSPGLTADHHALRHLARGATSGAGPAQAALPDSGPGSAFPRALVGPPFGNHHAARLVAANGDVFTHPDHEGLPSGSRPFTVEAFVHLSSGAGGGSFRTIAAHGSGTGLGWQFIVTGEGSGQGPRRLLLQFRADDNNGQPGGTLVTLNSGFELQTGVDYYVAIAFDPADTSPAGARFYLKNLTTGGPLQISERPHAGTAVWNSTQSFSVGLNWDGLLDEVRLTKRLLSPDQLLVAPASAAPTLYEIWAASHDFPDAASSAPDADPDADGLPNLLEYALGSDPMASDSAGAISLSVVDGPRLALAFRRIADPALVYSVEASVDLSSWTPFWQSTGAENVPGPVTVQDPEPLAAHPRRFLRLAVDDPTSTAP